MKNDFPDQKFSSVNSPSGLGSCVRKVLGFKSIRGRFEGLKPELRALGYERIEVRDKGFMFVKEKYTKDR